jgi:hypothetical protein
LAALVTNVVPLAGLALRALITAAGTPANGDTTTTGTGTFLVAENTSGAPITITIASPGSYEGDLTPLPARTLSVPATTGLSIIPLTDVHRDPATGLSALTYSATASLKVIVVRVP